MKGMYCTEWITWFTEQDSTKFEERFIRWTQREREKDVILFDKSTISVGTTTKIEKESSIYQIELPQIILEYICINGDMCILRRAYWKNAEDGKKLYEIPNCWDGVVPWYAY